MHIGFKTADDKVMTVEISDDIKTLRDNFLHAILKHKKEIKRIKIYKRQAVQIPYYLDLKLGEISDTIDFYIQQSKAHIRLADAITIDFMDIHRGRIYDVTNNEHTSNMFIGMQKDIGLIPLNIFLDIGYMTHKVFIFKNNKHIIITQKHTQIVTTFDLEKSLLTRIDVMKI